MLTKILSSVASIATGGATDAGGMVARIAAFTALVASIAGPAAWCWSHRDELAAVWNATLVSFTVGQTMIGSLAAGAFVYLVTVLAHRAPAP